MYTGYKQKLLSAAILNYTLHDLGIRNINIYIIHGYNNRLYDIYTQVFFNMVKLKHDNNTPILNTFFSIPIRVSISGSRTALEEI